MLDAEKIRSCAVGSAQQKGSPSFSIGSRDMAARDKRVAQARHLSSLLIAALLGNVSCGGGSSQGSGPPPLPPSVTWSVAQVSVLASPALPVTESLSLTATKTFSGAQLVVDAGIAQLVTVTPSVINQVNAGQNYPITITFSVPSGVPLGAEYQGAVHVEQGTTTLASSLPVVVEADSASSSAPDGNAVVQDSNGDVFPVNELILDLVPGATQQDAVFLSQEVGGSLVGFVPSINSYQVRLQSNSITALDAAISLLSSDPRVKLASKNLAVFPFGVQTDLTNLRTCEHSNSTLVGLGADLLAPDDRIFLESAWDLIQTQQPPLSSVLVGIPDSGLNRNHQEFNNPAIDTGVQTSSSPADSLGHGTGIAGIIGANNVGQLDCSTKPSSFQMTGVLGGISGLNYGLRSKALHITFSQIKILNFLFQLLADMHNLAQAGVTVINMSWGYGGLTGAAVKYVLQEEITSLPGILFVSAAGNDDIDASGVTPANIKLPNTITVGATDDLDSRAAFTNQGLIASNFGGTVDIAAPGDDVWAPALSPATYDLAQGTSISAPFVTGTAALLKALQPTLTPAQIKQTLVSSADDISPIDKPIGTCTLNADSTTYTCKRLNVLRAVQQVLGVSVCPPNGTILSLAVDPSNSMTVYAGASVWGMFKSTDGAQSWTKIDSGYPLTGIIDGSAQALAVNPSSTQTVYAGTFNYGVYKTTDGGQSWSAANTGLGNNDVRALAIDPQTPSTIYAGTLGGVFKSADGGQSWASASTGLNNSFVDALVIDPANTATVYAGTYGGGISKSIDGGSGWTLASAGLANSFVKSLTFDSGSSSLYAGTLGGVFKSSNRGQQWTTSSAGITDPAVLSLATASGNPATIYAGTQSGGIFRSRNGGLTWVAVNAGKTSYLQILALAADPSYVATAYAATLAGGVFKTTDEGQNWTASSCGIGP
jgi:Subtilase family